MTNNDFQCPECGTVHTSISARFYCCTETDRHGYKRWEKGTDWLP